MWHGISYFCLRHEKICFKVYVSCLSVDQPVNMCILVRYERISAYQIYCLRKSHMPTNLLTSFTN